MQTVDNFRVGQSVKVKLNQKPGSIWAKLWGAVTGKTRKRERGTVVALLGNRLRVRLSDGSIIVRRPAQLSAVKG